MLYVYILLLFAYEACHNPLSPLSLFSSPLAKSTVSIGDILVAVNARDVIYEELEDVIEFIHMIKYALH